MTSVVERLAALPRSVKIIGHPAFREDEIGVDHGGVSGSLERILGDIEWMVESDDHVYRPPARIYVNAKIAWGVVAARAAREKTGE